MRTIILIISLLAVELIITSASVYGQESEPCETYLKSLPANLKHDNYISQNYVMTTDYVDSDLFGNFRGKKRITGECSLMANGLVKWNNVRIAHSQSQAENFTEGEKQDIMEGFTYNPASNILSDTFFNSIPHIDVYLKNLVWDLTAFEVFAWYNWDSLALNEETPANDVSFELDIPELGTFENKDIRITWIGITKINDEICAIIDYKAMNNSLQFNTSDMNIKGRSHYWGNIYVSLADRQIEYAVLHEDVVMHVEVIGQGNGNYVNTVREITLEKNL
ncbi:MAG: hypothetical protein K9H26_00065 [Prolixibacteraceae bacterium]|nr:hypothetical protein [Prolixibacteraceae bacterium]